MTHRNSMEELIDLVRENHADCNSSCKYKPILAALDASRNLKGGIYRDALLNVRDTAIEKSACTIETQGDKWAGIAGCEERAVAAKLLSVYVRALKSEVPI